MKKRGFNHFLMCPNCRAVYEMVPIREISDVCKRCRWKRPKRQLCRMGINQYTKRVLCGARQYTGRRRKR
jgi:hypothetical protein